MQPRLDLITLAVADLAAARRFYVDGLGWAPSLDVPGEVVFLQVNHGLLIALFGAEDLADDMGLESSTVVPGAGFTLRHIVDSPEAVRQVLDRAAAAGATLVKPAQEAAWGGYHGYFADPDGIRWEVAHNPGWHVADDGRVTIRAVGEAPAGQGPPSR